jgi:hypothetical protein
MQTTLFDAVAPPVRGRTPQARQASESGARAIVETYSARQSAYLQVVRNAGAITDQEAASVLCWQLCSVNSVRGALNKRAEGRGESPLIVEDGHDEHRFTDGSGKHRVTYRTRWRIRGADDEGHR